MLQVPVKVGAFLYAKSACGRGPRFKPQPGSHFLWP